MISVEDILVFYNVSRMLARVWLCVKYDFPTFFEENCPPDIKERISNISDDSNELDVWKKVAVSLYEETIQHKEDTYEFASPRYHNRALPFRTQYIKRGKLRFIYGWLNIYNPSWDRLSDHMWEIAIEKVPEAVVYRMMMVI